jgi:hypothetical protein
MTIRGQFKRAVIEAIHGVPYEEAIEKESLISGCVFYSEEDKDNDYSHFVLRRLRDENEVEYDMKGLLYAVRRCYDEKIDRWCPDYLEPIGLPITIGRVMAALDKKAKEQEILYYGLLRDVIVEVYPGGYYGVDAHDICTWKFLNDDGTECADDDQGDETIEKLLKLLG